MENEKNTKTIKKEKVFFIAKIAIPLLIAILSFTCLSKVASSPNFHAKAIQVLDQKKVTVMELSAGAATVAGTTSLVLGDRALPVANKLMDLTGYFLVILCAIILEKYLLTILGVVSFKIILPISALLFILYVLLKNDGLKKLSIKLAIFSIVIFLVIPASVGIANLIEKTYQDDVKIVLESTKKIEEDANEIKEEVEKDEINSEKKENISVENVIEEIESDENFFSKAAKIFGNTTKSVGETAGNITKAIGRSIKTFTGKAKEFFENATKTLGNMIEAVAIMIVTTCILPILVFLFFIWIIKMFFNLDIKLGKTKE